MESMSSSWENLIIQLGLKGLNKLKGMGINIYDNFVNINYKTQNLEEGL